MQDLLGWPRERAGLWPCRKSRTLALGWEDLHRRPSGPYCVRQTITWKTTFCGNDEHTKKIIEFLVAVSPNYGSAFPCHWWFPTAPRSPQRSGTRLLWNQTSRLKLCTRRRSCPTRKGSTETAGNLWSRAWFLLEPFTPLVKAFWNSLVLGWGGTPTLRGSSQH